MKKHLPLLFVLVLAAALRLWRLDVLPPGLYHDEAYNGLDAVSLLEGRVFPQFYEGWELYAQEAHAGIPPQPTRFPLFFEGNFGREPLHVYLMALSIKIFGRTPFAIRLVPAIAGILAVLTTYFAATKINPSPQKYPRLPLLAAFFLAIFMPSIHFSRFGLRVMLFLPLETLAVAYYWQGLNRVSFSNAISRNMTQSTLSLHLLTLSPHHLAPFLLAGIFTGLALYTYAAARLFPLVFILFTLIAIWHDKPRWRGLLTGLFMMGGTAALIAAPLLLFFIRYPYFFLFRLAYVANKGKGAVVGKPWLTWLTNIGRVLRGLVWQGETHLRHNLPGRPFLDVIQSSFFLLGLLASFQKKNWRVLFLWIWLAVMLLPSILSGDAPHFGRMAAAAPALAIFAGIGVSHFLRKRRLPREQLSIINYQLSIITFLLLTSLFLTVRDYFGRYANHPQLAADFYEEDWDLGREMGKMPASTLLYLTPTQEEMATIYYAIPDWQTRFRSFNADTPAVPAGIPGQKAAIWTLPIHNLDAFPHQKLAVSGKISGKAIIFDAVPLPTETQALLGAKTLTTNWEDEIALRGWQKSPTSDFVLNLLPLQITLYWQAISTPKTDYTAFIHVVDNAGNIVLQVDEAIFGYPTHDWRSDEMVIYTFALPWTKEMPAGEYDIITGFYNPITQERLGEAVLLETFTVAEPLATSGDQ